MYKKLFAVMIVAVFLITSIAAISAEDTNSISVKITWDGDSQPDYVLVNLLKDGVVVDSAKLSAENSWSTTFKVDDDGEYKVSEIVSNDYSYSVKGDVISRFVISNHLVNEDVLKASGDKDTVTDGDGADSGSNSSSDGDGVNPSDDQPNPNSPVTNDTGNGTDNATGNSTEETSEQTVGNHTPPSSLTS